MTNYVCEKCKKVFATQNHFAKHTEKLCNLPLTLTRSIQPRIFKRKIKGCVYAIKTILENILHPDSTTLKIGHSRNVKHRFRGFDTMIADDAHKMENNLEFLLHSPSNAFDGTGIMESITHWYFSEFRLKKTKEFFRFEKDFNIDHFFHELNRNFLCTNITDVSVFQSLADVPYTNLPTNYFPEKDIVQIELAPREYQTEIVAKIIDYFRKNNKGGIYLPPGYGKTYISIICLQQLAVKKCLILTHRLSISREWEKCLTLAGIPFQVINSEHDYDLAAIRKIDNIYLISTYQTYLKNPTEFEAEYPYIVYDESHVLAMEGSYSICTEIKGNKMFLTATPKIRCFTDDFENCITQELDEKTYGPAIVHISLEDAIDQGCLCGYRFMIHNKPATVECYEHVEDLLQKYGRKKIVIFYNTRKDARNAWKHLRSKIAECWYIDGNTRREAREQIFSDFEKSQIGIIVNVDVMTEGVSIPCVDCILLMDKRNSIRVLIQMLGRALRLHEGKLCSIFCIPSDCTDTIEMVLTALVYDAKNAQSIRKNIITHSSSIKESKEIVTVTCEKLKWIEITRQGISGMINYNIQRLSDVVQEKGALVECDFIENGIILGRFQGNVVRAILGRNNYYKKHLVILEEKYPDLWKLLKERASIIHSGSMSRAWKSSDKIERLNQVVLENKTLVESKFITEDQMRLGNFQNGLLGAISGRNHRFNKELSVWEKRYEYLWELLKERVSGFAFGSVSRAWKSSDKIERLNQVVLENKTLVESRFITEDQMRLGNFQTNLLRAISGRTRRFSKELSVWEKRYEYLWKLLKERVSIIHSGSVSRAWKSSDKIERLNQVVLENKRLTTYKFITEDQMRLGQFQCTILGSISGRIDTYKKQLPGWEKLYPYLFKLLRDRVNRN
jgi:superfamily II DNA or RNA helicase/transposase